MEKIDMKIEELQNILREKNFKEEKRDSGVYYSKTQGSVKLICYIEPKIEIQFISYYKWDDNEVKGRHNLSEMELNLSKLSLSSIFKQTLNDMPEYIGDKANAHIEIRKVVDEIFREENQP